MPRLPTCLYLLSFFLSGLLFAQSTPQVIKLQGSLIRSGVGPVTGTVTMTIALHDAPTGGQPLASVGPMPVDVQAGVYAVDLPFPLSAFGGASRFIEITVNGEVLMPRVLLGSSAFAYVADTLDGHHAADLEESAEIEEKMAAHEAKVDPHPTYVLRTGDNMAGNLHVSGVVESSGGFKFPDGTIQMSAAVSGTGAPESFDVITKVKYKEPRASLEAPGGGTTAATRAPVYLPLSGGTMTGIPTLKPTDVAMILPAGGKGNTTSIEFQSQGDYAKGNWYISNFSEVSGGNSSDHVLTLGYNLKTNGTGGPTRVTDQEHAVAFSFESGWCNANALPPNDCDPTSEKGQVEFNINVVENITGPITTTARPFGWYYKMDRPYGKTTFTVGTGGGDDGFLSVGGMNYLKLNAGKGAGGNPLDIIMESATRWGDDPYTPARVYVKGINDSIQFRVQGDETQTAPLMQVENNFGAGPIPLFTVRKNGLVDMRVINFREGDYNAGDELYCNTGEFKVWADASEAVFKICENGGTEPLLRDAGRSLTLSGGGYDADTELYTQTRCLNVNPDSPVTDLLFFRTDKAITVTGIDCLVDSAGSLEMTLRECDNNAAGCGAIETALTCGTANTTETGGIDAAAVEAGHYLRVLIGRKSGTPAQGLICATFTLDD